MRFELHYAEMNLQGDIPCFKFNEQHELLNEILGFGKSKSMMQKMRSAKEVYLCAIVITSYSIHYTKLYDLVSQP